MKSLVVYYSRKGKNYSVGNIKEGNVEHIAKVIQKFTGADNYEIIPVKYYPNSYTETTEIASQELWKSISWSLFCLYVFVEYKYKFNEKL